MFIKKKNSEPTPLDLAITQALSDMQSLSVETPEYAKAVEHLTALYKLKETNSRKPVSPDVVIAASANLAGILLILHYEQAHVISSKALAFVMKVK